MNIKDVVIHLAISVPIAAIISYFSELPFWIMFLVIEFALIINSVLAECEDNRRGGFNNPTLQQRFGIKGEKFPKFPITVHYYEEDEKIIIEKEDEVEGTLEYFDSEDPEENASVTDAKGREVLIKVEHLEVKAFSLK